MYEDFSREDSELLKSICSKSEILSLSRVLSYDLADVLYAGDATLSIFTHPRHVALRADLAKIHQRLKFELGIKQVVSVERADMNLQRKYRIRLIPGPLTNRSYLRYYTLMASAIIESHLLRSK
jgi:hypothetical protein